MLQTPQGDVITLGKRIGSGGEGDVYEVVGKPDVLVKLYKEAIEANKAAKLQFMVAHQTADLLQLTAWVIEVVENEQKQIVGFLMPRLHNHKPIHDVYNTKSRKSHFPTADWRFLIHVATNVARAMAVIHAQGHVIGDVNHTSIWVTQKGTVRLIDCDSIQIKDGENVYKCEVGVPEFTPPELQGKTLSEVLRTPNHDNFGLATLIFHLLFLGRHPFSGVFLGQNEMNVPLAIREGRFAYGKHALGREMQPPPFTLPLEATSPRLVQLFQQAFMQVENRPTAQEWIETLEILAKNLKPCSNNNSHFNWQGATHCHWCALEAQSGSILFGAGNLPALRSELNALALPSLIQFEKQKPKPSQFAIDLQETIQKRTGQMTIGFALVFFYGWIQVFGFNFGLLLIFLAKPLSTFFSNQQKKGLPEVQQIEQTYIQARAMWYEQEQKHGNLLRASQEYADKQKSLMTIQEKLEFAEHNRLQQIKQIQRANPQASTQNTAIVNQNFMKEKQLLERSYQTQLTELRFLYAQLKDHVPNQASALQAAQHHYLQAKADFDLLFAD